MGSVDARDVLEHQWPYLLTYFPRGVDLEATARESGALTRRRSISTADTLLRLALAYGFCGLSLRQVTAWAEATGVASMSNVALLKRLRAAAAWLGHLLGLKLAEGASPAPAARPGFRLRLVDATTLSGPSSTGTDWRLHVAFDLHRLAIDHVEVTDGRGGETLTRFKVSAGECVVADRGYSTRRGIASIAAQGGDFIVRLNWSSLPLETPDGTPFDLFAALRALPDGVTEDFDVRTARSRDGIEPVAMRVVAVRKTEAAAEHERRLILRERSRKGGTADPLALEAAGYFIVVTSLSREALAAVDVLSVYRFRWQIEMAFKRLKGLVHLDELPARDPALARTFIYAKLLAALILDDFTARFLAISPWGFRLA